MKKFIEKFSNSNIRKMKLYKNMSAGSGVFKLTNTPIVFQTIWSDMAHIAVFDKNYSGNSEKYDIDFKDFEQTSYQVFQDNSMFPEYNIDDKCIDVKQTELNGFELRKISEDQLFMINRIPQEISLDIDTDSDINIVNTGDSKLVADKFFKVNMKGENKFDCRRLRTNTFDFIAEYVIFTIKSSLETKVFNFKCLESTIFIKKLGVVNHGSLSARIGNIDIRSIYSTQKEWLEMNIYEGMIKIGSLQGNLKIDTNSANIIIENLDCNKLIIDSKDNNEIEIFINNIKEESEINTNEINPHKLFINKEASQSFSIIWNNELLYGLSDNKNIMKLNTKVRPEISEVEYWDYMKRKIQRVIDLKKKNLI
jgi:hypothetical protein